ncbi:hypothetical protein GY45DRAFT_795282 [Cubamyces sp. BRFM 1775]|nr:hypothetical protein GY45DRAFT_795282 [Cubamyces sp. BRFM 1775]
MVFVGDKKYACETCIKGHRSSSCKHTDRPLFEIKKKGRPVTQCEHCRELRKTRQIHVKCVCESKESSHEVLGPGSSGQGVVCWLGTFKVPARAAFPSGLPLELLEASAASRPLSEGSDSDHAGRSCACKDDASCNCWTPRHRPRRNTGHSVDARPAPASLNNTVPQPAALVISAHSGNNRPVLPKPPVERSTSPSRNARPPALVPSSTRVPIHGQSLYSPYGRAYEITHGAESPHQQPSQSLPHAPMSLHHLLRADNNNSGPAHGEGSFGDWPPPNPTPLCNCGSTCACAGCLEHNGPNVDLNASCANPSTCVACLECNLTALTSLASEITQPAYDNSAMQNVDEWLRQMSTMPDFSASSMDPAQASTQLDPRFNPLTSQPYGHWSDSRNTPSYPATYPMESECCGGRCKCPVGMCGCPPDCCGCCQGCNCVGCNHDTGSERTLTFATSGERAPCCGGREHPSDRSSQLLSVPRETSSRGTSLSSNSSPIPSPSSVSPMPYSNATDTPRDAPEMRSCCGSMGNLSMHAQVTGSSQQPGPNVADTRAADHNAYNMRSTRSRRFS